MIRSLLAALFLASPLNAQVVTVRTSASAAPGAGGAAAYAAPAIPALPAPAPGLGGALAPALSPAAAAPAPEAAPAAARSLAEIKRLKIGSYNVENLFEQVGKHVPDPDNPGKLKKVSDARPKPEWALREEGRIILENDLDVMTLAEVENVAALEDFNARYLEGKYKVFLIEGNDERGIDIAFLVKKDLPFAVEQRSHKDETWTDPVLGGGPRTLFSRDLTSLVVRSPGKSQPLFVLFGTHYKSKRDRDQSDPESVIMRTAQVKRTAEIMDRYRREFGAGVPLMIAGDFNGDVAEEAAYKPLFDAAGLTDSFDAAPVKASREERVTHTYHPRGEAAHQAQMDAVLVSGSLRGAVTSAKVYRYKNADGTERPIPKTFAERELNPSDHFPLLVTLDFTQIRGPATFDEIPPLDARYATPESRARTVTVLGSSKSVDPIKEQVALSGSVAGELIRRGWNVLTGAGSAGVMGASYRAAAESAAAQAGPGENLVIAVRPAWGDENLSDARAIGIADSEAERIEKFAKASESFLIFPGSAGSLQEAATLIAKNAYRGRNALLRVILVGRDFFGGLSQQYQRLFEDGLLKERPETLFRVVDTKEEALADFAPLDAGPKADAELAAFAEENLKTEDPVLRARTLALVSAYLSAAAPRREAAYALSTAYYDGFEALEIMGRRLEAETRRQLETMLAVLDSVVPRAKARRHNEPEINRLINTFEPLLGAFDRRHEPPEIPPVPLTPAQNARLFADGARAWLASSGAAFDAKNSEWAAWTEKPGKVSDHTKGNLRAIRRLIDQLQIAKIAFAREAAAAPATGELTPESVRALYDAWDRLRSAANDALIIVADSNDPDPARRGLMANVDQNTIRHPGGFELFLAPGRAVDWDAARALNDALRQ